MKTVFKYFLVSSLFCVTLFLGRIVPNTGHDGTMLALNTGGHDGNMVAAATAAHDGTFRSSPARMPAHDGMS